MTPGTKLGPYEILTLVGKGGMGEVYKAHDPRLKRDVAIKVSAEQFSERFEREAQAIAALNHPNICTLYDVGPNYLVMEYVEGTPLKGPLPLDQALKYAAQICDALDAAHKKGITHRDLKPANILVTKAGIKLLDFGLAKLASSGIGQAPKPDDATLTMALTGRNEIVGTLYYMSPEQLQSQATGQEADARSDIFSFGLVLYEMLTGKRAFEGSSPASVIAAIVERPAPSVSSVAPAALDRVLQRCLAKDPDERFQNALDLKAALLWAVEPLPDAIVVRAGSRRWWIAIVAALVLGAGAAWGVAHFGAKPAANEDALRLQIEPPAGGRFVFDTSLGGIALSPDGKTAAFVARVDGKTGMWVRPFDTGISRLLAGTEGAAFPFWSPDGKSIGFFTGKSLLRVDLEGGAPLTICDVTSGRGGAWTDDGRILFGSLGPGLFQVSASGGTASLLIASDRSRFGAFYFWPQMLRDGKFLYLSRGDRAESSSVFASSLAKPSERVRLLTTETNVLYGSGADGSEYLLWLRGGTLVAQAFDSVALKLKGEPHPLAESVAQVGISGQMDLATSASGLLLYGTPGTMSQFTWFDRTGKPQGAVGEPGGHHPFRLSPDGRTIAAMREKPSGSDVWLLEVERGLANRLTYDSQASTIPVWSPDGRTIAFQSGSLFRADASGSGNAQPLTKSGDFQSPSDWSRDGRYLLYVEIVPGGRQDLWVLEMTPDGRAAAGSRPYLKTPFNKTSARFYPQPNPRWVAYQSDESGRWEIYVQSFPEPGRKWQISTSGGRSPAWSPDGRELYYSAPGSKLTAVSLKLGPDSVEPSNPHELFELPVDDSLNNPFEVSPDGRRFLVRTLVNASPPLNVIVNWPALLKEGSPAQ